MGVVQCSSPSCSLHLTDGCLHEKILLKVQDLAVKPTVFKLNLKMQSLQAEKRILFLMIPKAFFLDDSVPDLGHLVSAVYLLNRQRSWGIWDQHFPQNVGERWGEKSEHSRKLMVASWGPLKFSAYLCFVSLERGGSSKTLDPAAVRGHHHLVLLSSS